MSKYFTDNGFLSENGKALTEGFRNELEKLFGTEDVKEMTESELQTLGANLSKMAGDHVSAVLSARNVLEHSLSNMTDEQFVAFMKAKYGEKWMLVGVSKEELNRVKQMAQLTDEQIREALAKGAEAGNAYLKTVRPLRDSGIRYK